VKSISLDPHEGGVTHMQGGISALTLPAGYLGSSLIGALLIFCGFDIVASKVASIVLGVCFLLTLWWARKDWLTIGTVILAVGLLVACWFIAHAEPLRYVVVSIRPLQESGEIADIIGTAFHRCHVCPLQRLGYLRRSHPSQSKYLRRQRLCPEVWRLLGMLGCYLGDHISPFHGCSHRCWNCRIP
jgi:hypothetical protein